MFASHTILRLGIASKPLPCSRLLLTGISFFLSYQNNYVSLQIEMEQAEVIKRIAELGKKILPEGASLWLYGSRARGDAHPDSDYDLLILIDKDNVTPEVDSAAYDICLMGYDYGVEINPHIYSKKKWSAQTHSPFYKNVEQDKMVLI